MLPPLLRTSRTRTRLFARRPSTRHVSLDANQSIYVSQSTNPYFNLTLEDWLFKHKPVKEPLLLLYRDTPCVVIGRNQNPWKEVNLPALAAAAIPFIRRRSGGGTVYHDLGNTNFSIHLPRSEFDRHATAQVVLRAVRALRLAADVNERNDICVGPYKMSSAYKIVRERAYHHGTMLIASGLSTLGEVLHVTKDSMVTKGVASVRSPVRNLRDFQPDVTHEAFVDAVVQAFREEYGIHDPARAVTEDEDTLSIPEIRDGMAELPEWDWAFGQTPEFTYTVEQVFPWGDTTARIHSKHGIILSCEFSTANQPMQEKLAELAAALKEKRYGFVEDASLRVDLAGPMGDVWRWLKAKMAH